MRKNYKLWFFSISFGILGSVLSGSATAQVSTAISLSAASGASYTVLQLEPLASDLNQFRVINDVWGINNKGQVVGSSNLNNDNYLIPPTHAVFWPSGSAKPTDLGSEGQALGINDNGVIVGEVSNSNGGAALWQPGSTSITVLNGLSGSNFTLAFSINNNGQVVGTSGTQDSNHAVLWQSDSTTAIDLGALGNAHSSALSINSNGQIVGFVYNGIATFSAVFWDTGATTAHYLSTLGGSISEASQINANGEMVGYASTSGNNSTLGVLWQSSSAGATALGTLGGANSYASGINASGQVVGTADTTTSGISHAVLWQPGSTTPTDLNTLVALSSGYLRNASYINDKGQIIATDSNGFRDLLTPIGTPVPLPAAIWLFVSSIVGLICIKRPKQHF